MKHDTVELVKDSDGDYAVLFKGRAVNYFANDALGLQEAKNCYEQTVMEQIL